MRSPVLWSPGKTDGLLHRFRQWPEQSRLPCSFPELSYFHLLRSYKSVSWSHAARLVCGTRKIVTFNHKISKRKKTLIKKNFNKLMKEFYESNKILFNIFEGLPFWEKVSKQPSEMLWTLRNFLWVLCKWWLVTQSPIQTVIRNNRGITVIYLMWSNLWPGLHLRHTL